MSVVRANSLTIPGYTPYCGADSCGGRWPRTTFDGAQFYCSACGWRSSFPSDFIAEYLSVRRALERDRDEHMDCYQYGIVPAALAREGGGDG